MNDAGEDFKDLVKSLVSPEISIEKATEILSSLGKHYGVQEEFMKYGFFRILKVIPVFTLINLFERFTSINLTELKDCFIGGFNNIAQKIGNLEDKKQLFDYLAKFPIDPEISEIRAILEEQLQNYISPEIPIEGIQSNEFIDYNAYEFDHDESQIKDLQIGLSLRNGHLDLAGAQSVNVTQITVNSSIKDIENIQPNEREICFFRLSEYPKFYKIHIERNRDLGKGFRHIYFDQCLGTLQDNINTFHKLERAEKNAKKDERERFAQSILMQIVEDLLLFRAFTMFHAKIVPENILLFADKNDPNNVIAKIVNGRCAAYDNDGFSYIGVTIDKVGTYYSRRFNAPEIRDIELYKTEFSYDTNDINFNICDIFSLGIITLNILTDNSVDKWNNIVFSQTLVKTVNETVDDFHLKHLILKMTDKDYTTRATLEAVADSLGIIKIN